MVCSIHVLDTCEILLQDSVSKDFGFVLRFEDFKNMPDVCYKIILLNIREHINKLIYIF